MKDVRRHIEDHFNNVAYAEGYKLAEDGKPFEEASSGLMFSASRHSISDAKMNYYKHLGYLDGKNEKENS